MNLYLVSPALAGGFFTADHTGQPHFCVCVCVCLDVYVCMYVYHMCFINSSVDGHLDNFHVLTVVNSTAVNTAVPVSFQIMFSLNVCPGVRFLDNMTTSFSFF